MKRLLFALMLFAALPLAAQEPKNPLLPQYVSRLFILKYADPGQLKTLLSDFGASMRANLEMHALAVSNSSPEIMAAIEDVIKRLDVPPPPPQNIELTVYYLIGADSENAGGPLPKDLDSVATQLKNAFPFKSYRLLDALELRTRNRQGADGSGSPGPNAAGVGATVTQFHMNSASVSPDGSSVRIDNMKAGVKIPVAKATTEGGYSYVDLGVNADVDIKPGQKVVAGHLSMGQNQALFLVLMVRVVN